MSVVASLVLFVISIVLAELLRPKQRIEDARPSGLGDFDFPTATSARVQPIVFGRVKVAAPNVVWYGDLFAEPISKYFRQSYFSGKRVITGYRYYVGVQLMICRGPIDSLTRMWVGDSVVSSSIVSNTGGTAKGLFLVRNLDLFGGEETGGGGFHGEFDVYFGNDNQDPSAYLAKFQAGDDITQQPTWPGTAYVVARRPGIQVYINGELQPFPPGGCYVGTSSSIKPWAFEVTRFPARFGSQAVGENTVSDGVFAYNANPLNVIYEWLTNNEWGRGELVADINVAAFQAAAAVVRSEGNGFAMQITSPMDDVDLLEEVERQIDGRFFLDPEDGKWTVKLARADYDVDTVPQLTSDNIIEVREYTQGTWSGTVNQIQVEFHDRQNDYKVDHAFAQDQANMLMQGGGSVSTLKIVNAPRRYPGVMDARNAARLAWRDLRAESVPLARATFVVDRTFWNVKLLDVVAWTDSDRGVTKLPMRVIKIDGGDSTKQQIVLTCVQDVFAYQTASFGDPPATGWTPPSSTLVDYPAADRFAFEAPRAIIVRDPDYQGDPTISRVMTGARQQGLERSYVITQRNSVPPTLPSGDYFQAGEVFGFVYVGRLKTALAAGQANPVSTITLVANPNSAEQIESAFVPTNVNELGVDLPQLIMVGEEFMLVSSAEVVAGEVVLSGVYRGALDSGQQPHAANASVIMLGAGTGLTSAIFPNTNYVDVELRMVGIQGEVYDGAVVNFDLLMDKRAIRPYPAAALLYNGSSTAFGTPSLEGAGSGIGGFRLDVRWWRRRYDVTNEVAALLSDDSTVDGSTEYQLEVRADPDGANVLVGSVSAWTTGAGPLQVSRADIVTAAAAGTPLRLILRTRHDIGSESNLESRIDLRDDVTPTSSLVGQFYLGGGIAANVPSSTYAAAATGTFTMNIGAAQSTAAIEVSINGGAWSSVIAAGLTTGTFSATAGDDLRFRRTVSEAPNPQFVELRNPSSAAVAYGTFSS